jgi:hypothetical protein
LHELRQRVHFALLALLLLLLLPWLLLGPPLLLLPLLEVRARHPAAEKHVEDVLGVDALLLARVPPPRRAEAAGAVAFAL